MKITFVLPTVSMSGGIRVVAIYAQWLVSPFHDNMIIVVGTLTILLVGLAVSRFAKRQIREDRQRIDPEIIGIKELAT